MADKFSGVKRGAAQVFETISHAMNPAQESNHARPFDLNNSRRALKECDLKALMPEWSIPDEPLLIPTGIAHRMIGKFTNNLFPYDTIWMVAKPPGQQEPAINQPLLEGIIEQTKFLELLDEIISEAAWLDYCAIRMVAPDNADKWIVEVINREFLELTPDPEDPRDFKYVTVTYPRIDPDGKKFWFKERWSKDTVEIWKPVGTRIEVQTAPKFDKDPVKTDVHFYGEIPFTIVYHKYDSKAVGKGTIGKHDVLTLKATIRLLNKQHFSHLVGMAPLLSIKDAKVKSGRVSRAASSVLMLESDGEAGTGAEVKYVEMGDLPQSVQDELYNYTRELYEMNGLTAPSKEEFAKTGIQDSGVAVRLTSKDDEQTIKTLRGRGYANVIRALEKMLRMGARVGMEAYSSVNPEDPQTWRIECKFSEFFPMTLDDKTKEAGLINLSPLPAEQKAQRWAQVMGVDDPDVINEMAAKLQEEEDMAAELSKATVNAAHAAAGSDGGPPQ